MRLDLETRYRSILPLLAVVMGAVYLFVFVPLDRKARSLDTPLQQSWRQLADALGHTNALKLDFSSITNQFKATRTAITAFETALRQARARVELDPGLRDQVKSPFAVVEYQYEAGRRMDALIRHSKQAGVQLEPAVLVGFPKPSADMQEPSLLWAELLFLDSLLTTAINAKVTTVHYLAAELPLTNSPPTDQRLRVAELPLQVELTGGIASVARFLQALPLRGDEIQAAGLPAAPTNKPALFMDRLVLRKSSIERPDEVRVSLRAVGFVFQR